MLYVILFPSDSAWWKVVFLKQEETNESWETNPKFAEGSGSVLWKQWLPEHFL